MIHYLQDVYFPPFGERRRPIRKILPTKSDGPEPASGIWADLALCIAIAVLLISVASFQTRSGDSTVHAFAHPGSLGPPLYQWFGFHRVAP